MSDTIHASMENVLIALVTIYANVSRNGGAKIVQLC